MDARIRRYFTFRKHKAKTSQTTPTTNEIGLISISYESTRSGRAPVLSSESCNKGVARTKEDLDVVDAFAIRAVPYESAAAGTPPVFGATPIKGNGPVKLQTSRRLSSGELLVTTQDHQRTLSDIRDGEYIVGRKEPKRLSKTISIKLPLHSRASSPRASLALPPQTSSPSPAQSPKPARAVLHKRVPEPILVDHEPETPAIPVPEALPRSPHSRRSSVHKAYILGPTEVPLPLSPAKPPSSRNSLLSRGEEQNATIQALWKAEYARLVAIYGQDGVDRNIAELNKDHFGTFPEKRLSVDNAAKKFSVASAGLPKIAVHTINSPCIRSPRGSFAHEPPYVDNGSDDSSAKAPSVLSSEESSSSYTRRTSLFEADVPTTREEVGRIVENMRKNYLKALEARAEAKPKAKRPKRAKQRASYAHRSVPAAPPLLKSSKAGRQSWHASTNPSRPKQEKQSSKAANFNRPKTPRESTVGPTNGPARKSSLKAKPQLHRADSTTLGSFFGPKQDDQKSPSSAGALKLSGPGSPPGAAHLNDTKAPTHESVATSSSEDVAPEIDDFDIFYQDLAREAGHTPGTVKPAIPTISVPDLEEIPPEPDDAAPPPPNIDWTPRKRAVVAAL